MEYFDAVSRLRGTFTSHADELLTATTLHY